MDITEIGCMTHARRKFFDLHATNKSQLAEKALHYIAALYEVEREVRELEPDGRQRIRQEKAASIIDALHTWMIARKQLVPEGSAIAKALDYSLKRWIALTVWCPSTITGSKSDPALGTWSLELAVCGLTANRMTYGCHYECDPVDAAQRT